MMQNFGIDFLISYFHNDIDDTTELINPQWRDIDKQVRGLNTKLQKLRAKFAELILEGELQETKMEKYKDKKSQLQEDISIFQIELNGLKTKRGKIHRKIPFGELPEEEKFKAVYNNRKQFIDTIKLIVYRAETALANTIKQYMAKPAEARALMAQIFKTDADFKVDNKKDTLEINVHHLATNRDNKALSKLCKELIDTQTHFPGTNLRLIYKLVSK
jgi:chromosome segregation ATPase